MLNPCLPALGLPGQYTWKEMTITLSNDSCPEAKKMFWRWYGRPTLFAFTCLCPATPARFDDPDLQLRLLAMPTTQTDGAYVASPSTSWWIPTELAARWPVASFFTMLFASLGWPTDWTVRLQQDRPWLRHNFAPVPSWTQEDLAQWAGGEPAPMPPDCPQGLRPDSLLAFIYALEPAQARMRPPATLYYPDRNDCTPKLHQKTQLYVILRRERKGKAKAIGVTSRPHCKELVQQAVRLLRHPTEQSCTFHGQMHARHERGELFADTSCDLSGGNDTSAMYGGLDSHHVPMALLARRLHPAPVVPSSHGLFSSLASLSAECMQHDSQSRASASIALCPPLHHLWCDKGLFIDPVSCVIGAVAEGSCGPYVQIAMPEQLRKESSTSASSLSAEGRVWLAGLCLDDRSYTAPTLRDRPGIFAQCCENLFAHAATDSLWSIVMNQAQKLKENNPTTTLPASAPSRILTWADYHDMKLIWSAAVDAAAKENSDDLFGDTAMQWCIEMATVECSDSEDLESPLRQALQRQRPHLHDREFLDHEKWTVQKRQEVDRRALDRVKKYRAVYPLYLARASDVLCTK
ncbi:unnamed protein product [Parajaminaea phylloscopi]